MFISLIIITYNRLEMLKRALESARGQTYGNYEIIVVNNGSADGTADYLSDIAESDNRVIIKSIEASTIGRGRNIGLDLAVGDYITFLDDDDEIRSDMLEMMARLTVSHSSDIAVCGTMIDDGQKRWSRYSYEGVVEMDGEESVIEMLKREKYNVGLPTKLIRKTLFDDIRFHEKDRYEDIRIGYRLFAKSHKVVAFDEPLYIAYRHGQNNSDFTTNDLLLSDQQLQIYLDAFEERTRFLSTVFEDMYDFLRYCEWSYMISMVNKIRSADLQTCKVQYERMVKELEAHRDDFRNSPYIKDFETSNMKKYFGIGRNDDESNRLSV